MKSLITGITGLAGSHLAEHLLACGDEVIGCAQSGNWNGDAPDHLVEKVDLLPWNVSGPLLSETRHAIEAFEPDAIYHLAAMSAPADCGDAEPNELAAATNIGGTRAVLDLAASLSSRPRVLFTSTCSVYRAVDADNPRVCESAPLGPASGYGKTKLAAEQEVADAVRRRGVDAIVARAFHHTGPRQMPRFMLPEWAEQFARGGRDPIVVQCRDTYLDLGDVRDVVRAYRLLVEKAKTGAIYNVGTGVCRRSGDVLEMLQDRSADKRPIVELSPGCRQQPIADITQLVATTGWQPCIPIEQTIRDVLSYWQDQVVLAPEVADQRDRLLAQSKNGNEFA